ncbi:bifunctional 5,10-methylenetetrahydrofolate dehydrogenase/5,10-methenyltetrahydrofolate cyclohydrolase [Pseudonocardia charpentierae]|uniref:Bifunctional protein FolD n=1 Tax=Pseudonocardia charpentierae TaxID=3075545 RepID=A0ABU2N6E0_9PSEU|nr:bifunctional 5,10-methylenetetrahydrofolate dehydrogenase/5,10-methenyltetrahydrofolate cyclohydrolase [Pseudonocardia sp. DSM 45834]MDT0349505.1 bifunctional 5,10-methylenetetrahydrofolate dehydrogenase/5,10-methenyltetrahydrofolate cyclohydrolase [Pseudonocardia sp. DSM 45834]
MTRPQTTQLLEGKKSAAAIREEAAAMVQELRAAGTVPGLALVLATADESAAWYTRAIARAGEKVGIDVRVERLADDASADVVRSALQRLSADDTVHGIILQTPLPPGVDGVEVAIAIAPEKDVDGGNPVSIGRLTAGLPAFAPATAAGVMRILDDHGVELAGRRVVVVGRSLVVGKPAAMLLLARDATVTICHSRTRDLAARTSEAEVLVAAVGRPRMIGAEHVGAGAVVIDVGTTPDEDGNLVGDVDAEAVTGHAGALTPVPGGVGPVTTALLLLNTVTAAARAAG